MGGIRSASCSAYGIATSLGPSESHVSSACHSLRSISADPRRAIARMTALVCSGVSVIGSDNIRVSFSAWSVSEVVVMISPVGPSRSTRRVSNPPPRARSVTSYRMCPSLSRLRSR